MLIVFLSKYIQSLVRKAIVLLFFAFSQNSLASYFYDYDLSIRLNLEQLEHCGHEFNSLLSYPINYSNIYKSLKSKNKETNDALCDEIEYWFRTELEALENKNNSYFGVYYHDDPLLEINGTMVFNGRAIAYTRYSKRYLELENSAKKDKAGIWRYGFKETPEQWRRKKK